MLAREIADPRVGFVTITKVETTPDLRHAKVWASVIGSEAERDAALTALGHAMPFVRHQLGGRLRLKRIPELHVRADDTFERGTRILSLLGDLERGVDPAGLEPVDPALPTPVARLPRDGDAEPEPAPLADAPRPPRRRRRPGRRP